MLSWRGLVGSRLPKEAESSQQGSSSSKPSSSKFIKESRTNAFRAQLSELNLWSNEGGESLDESILHYVQNSDHASKIYKPFPSEVLSVLTRKEGPVHEALTLGPISRLDQHFGETAKWSTEVMTEVDRRQVALVSLQITSSSAQEESSDVATASSSLPLGRVKKASRAKEHSMEGSLHSSTGQRSLRQDFVLKAINPNKNNPTAKLCMNSRVDGLTSGMEEFIMIGEVKRADKLSLVVESVRKVSPFPTQRSFSHCHFFSHATPAP